MMPYSFKRKFNFNIKNGDSLTDALEKSKRVDIKLNRKTEYIADSKKFMLNWMMFSKN